VDDEEEIGSCSIFETVDALFKSSRHKPQLRQVERKEFVDRAIGDDTLICRRH
jgi:hypothetical protein